jgi:hypothetical protein
MQSSFVTLLRDPRAAVSKITLPLALLVIAGSSLFGARASVRPTCECYEPGPFAVRESAHAIFVGRVERVSQVRPDAPLTATMFRVSESWKGVYADSVVVYTESECYDYDFGVGMKYLVFATYPRFDQSSERLWVSMCSGTRLYDDAEKHLYALGRSIWPERGCVAIREVRGRSVCERR